jgi:Xaa-Pro aminopeptidase
MLTPILSRQRQKPLLYLMQRRKYDAIFVGAPHHVYYLAAHWTHYLHLSCLAILADGRSILVTANQPNKAAAADDLLTYEANVRGTLRQEQAWMMGQLLKEEVLRKYDIGRIGADASVVTSALAMQFDGPREEIDDDLFQMRRVKYPDELELMSKAIQCCQAMYRRAGEIIEPGVPELEVFGQLHTAAVLEAGEPLGPTYLGNDYACGVAGGPARGGRVAQEGELYILDLGPAYRGYFSDNARTFAVNRKPTDAQHKAWERVVGCFKIVEEMAKPGVYCVDIFNAVDEYLKSARGEGMGHHLGHGVGLSPHEFPHLNPDWDDRLMEGEVFTAEPGEYSDAIGGGIRIEQDYLVTKDGVQPMIHTPLGLVPFA